MVVSDRSVLRLLEDAHNGGCIKRMGVRRNAFSTRSRSPIRFATGTNGPIFRVTWR